MLKEKLKNFGTKIYIGATTAFALGSATCVHADSQITKHTPSEVASHIFTANQGIAEAFGGALIGIAVVVIGIKMLMASKKQEARSEAMDSILTVIIASLLIGGFAIFAGLFFGFGQ
ncbi:hypothetical protein [Clostridium felsineum]|uniref:Uncharacterized protein n=1 Tax=Clostridium felsineum TaxID=36839 RepID=A0A1S8LDD2_9CLOT|nr:hypothetical protein [Clostridium felsineum]URZ05885.1 hypothetical protein CLROS_012170 [Clostridium felsineum]URZ10922.1 hypothetical protein CROST_016380 [Clostridium felsineum]